MLACLLPLTLLLAGPALAESPLGAGVQIPLEDRAEQQAGLALTLAFDTLHGLHGGDRYRVERGVLTHVHAPGRGQPTVRTRTTLTTAQLTTLQSLLAEIQAEEQREPERRPRPDESKAVLTRWVDGQEVTTWEWFNDLEANQRLVRIQRLLHAWSQPAAP